MRVDLAGQRFCVEPDHALSPAEHDVLHRLIQSTRRDSAAPSTPVTLQVGPLPWPGANVNDYPDFSPAQVSVVGQSVRLGHRRFLAEIDPAQRRARLYRCEADGMALGVTLRIALASTLPAQGGLPLHAAGVVMGCGGVVFFGPSGAGKSTLAATSPFPVLSDELVAVTGDPFELLATGFWGTMGEAEIAAPRRLVALVELDKGPCFCLERLSPGAALRRLLGVIQVPALGSLWGVTLAVLGRLVRTTPVYRMAWNPATTPWDALEEALATPSALRS